MCNLYRMDRATAEVARLFDAEPRGGNVPAEIYPGRPGAVIAQGMLRSMVWGFPLTLAGRKPKPVNNTRADKLDSFFWRFSFAERRCLIPMSAFAEAEGPKGGKTRTWLALPDRELFACAGIWRESDEWGPVYSLVMTEACVDMGGIHDRMPVILAADEEDVWLHGASEEARALCRPWPDGLAIRRTDQPWVAPRP